jgi:hypothetical protein
MQRGDGKLTGPSVTLTGCYYISRGRWNRNRCIFEYLAGKTAKEKSDAFRNHVIMGMPACFAAG